MVKGGGEKGFMGERARSGRCGIIHVLLSWSEFILKVSGSIRLLYVRTFGGDEKNFF